MNTITRELTRLRTEPIDDGSLRSTIHEIPIAEVPPMWGTRRSNEPWDKFVHLLGNIKAMFVLHARVMVVVSDERSESSMRMYVLNNAHYQTGHLFLSLDNFGDSLFNGLVQSVRGGTPRIASHHGRRLLADLVQYYRHVAKARADNRGIAEQLFQSAELDFERRRRERREALLEIGERQGAMLERAAAIPWVEEDWGPEGILSDSSDD